MKEECFDCGHELRWRHRYTVDDPFVCRITVHGKYLHCPNCGSDEVPYETLKMVEDVRKKMAERLQLNRIGSSVEFERQYIRTKEAAAILELSYQAVAQSKVIRNCIYNLFIDGKRYWLKESVERFRDTGEGRFPLVKPQDDVTA